MRHCVVLLALALLTSATVRSQPKLEVASIRRCPEPRPLGGVAQVSPGRITYPCISLVGLILNAYGAWATGTRVQPSTPYQLEAAPGWLSAELYEINMKAEDNASEGLLRGPLTQELLEDRFKLKLHRETRQVPVYALTISKNDAKLRPHEQGACTPPNASGNAVPLDTKPTCKGTSISRGPTKFTLQSDGGSLDQLLIGLNGIGATDRPVLNRTGLTNIFDVHLEFAPMLPTAGVTAADDPALPSIFTALEEQLGLRLESSKGPQEFLVIDSIECASEN